MSSNVINLNDFVTMTGASVSVLVLSLMKHPKDDSIHAKTFFKTFHSGIIKGPSKSDAITEKNKNLQIDKIYPQRTQAPQHTSPSMHTDTKLQLDEKSKQLNKQ